ALSSAGAKVLDGDEEQAPARDLGKLGPQPGDDLIRGDVALRQRLERHEDRAGVDRRQAAAAAGPGISDDALDRGILAYDCDHLLELLTHRLERYALVGLHDADQPPRVLLWKESLRHDLEQEDIEPDGHEQAEHHERPVAQRPGERTLVA